MIRRNLGAGLGCFMLGIVLSAGSARADCKGKTADECLSVAYESFCREAQPIPQVTPLQGSPECLAQTRQGVRWLRLNLYCGCDSNRPATCLSPGPVGCSEFFSVRSQLEPLVLAFDHSAGTWNAAGKLDEKRVKRDVAGRPTVSLTPEEDLIVVVERTNPLFYSVSRGTVTEAPTPEVAQLQKLAGLLGGNIQSLLASVADAQVGAQAGSAFKDYLGKLKPALDQLNSSQADVACLLRQASEQKARIVAFVQAIELGQQHDFPVSPRACTGPGARSLSLAEVSNAFEALGAASVGALALDPGCPSVLTAALKVLAQDGTKPAEVRAAINEFNSIRDTEVCQTDLQRGVVGLGDNTFPAIASAADPDLPDELASERATRLELQSTLALALKWKTVTTAAATLAGERDNAGKAVAAIVGFDKLLRANVIAAPKQCPSGLPGDCQSAAAVDRRLFLESNAKPVQWDKIQTHPITVKAVSPFAASVVASRPASLDTSISLDSVQRGLWGVGASVIWTRLKSPTFGAITNPANPAQMIIAETEQEIRAGGLALLVDYKLGRRLFPASPFGRNFGLEFGAAADTAKPGFFGGLSVQLGKYVRLGGGLTYQRIKALRGQHLGDVVKAAGDIKTRQKFANSTYISLSIAIEPLRLFNVN